MKRSLILRRNKKRSLIQIKSGMKKNKMKKSGIEQKLRQVAKGNVVWGALPKDTKRKSEMNGRGGQIIEKGVT